jgi:predicted deacetylase
MSARFLIRFDDICPTLNWKVWQEIERILIEEDVKPILAVIPDNQDPQLLEDSPDEHFWDRVRAWQARGWTIGLHGYRHQYVTQDSGIMGVNKFSEFAGLPLEEQRAKLEKAVEIFAHEGVHPDVWVAPAHSFDANTVRALVSVGINTISDGSSLYPHRDAQGVFWVPQQLWNLRPVPFGVWTVCIHYQDAPYTDLVKFRQRIREYKQSITSFPEMVEAYKQRKKTWMDSVFLRAWKLAIRVKGGLRARRERAQRLAALAKSESDSTHGLKAAH